MPRALMPHYVRTRGVMRVGRCLQEPPSCSSSIAIASFTTNVRQPLSQRGVVTSG